jgi:hypothetical protein
MFVSDDKPRYLPAALLRAPLPTDPGIGITIDENKLKAQVGEPRPYLPRYDIDAVRSWTGSLDAVRGGA